MRHQMIVALLASSAVGLAATAQEDDFAPASYAQDAYAQPDYEGFEQTYNAFGQPDFSGVWSNATTTPVERPRDLGDQLILTEEQAAQIQGGAEDYRVAGDFVTDQSEGAPTDGNTSLGYNRFWTDPGTQVMRVNGEPRSSFITVPENGRVPPRREGAPESNWDIRRESSEFSGDSGQNDNPEARGLPERCIFMPTTAGPVLRPVLYNNNYVIAQGRDAVAISVEMIHDTKVIRLDSEHRDDGVRPWMGDSIGWYEGDTLVVETTDFHPQQSFYGASEDLKVIERFTQVADNRLLYQFTVEDPQVWEEPWGGEYEFWKSAGFYEYACHEGNYGMIGILSGNRRDDAQGGED
ncbi:MAG: hypothetical protein PVI23_02505 [Maricaulaceae bacterium]